MHKSAKLFVVLAAFFTSLPSACGGVLLNDDFSGGNTGFSSDYVHEGGGAQSYHLVTDPSLVNPFFSSFGDHTTGTGLMMVVNGSMTADQIVWSQTVPVQDNAVYDFSFWTASVYHENPAILRLTINDVQIGGLFGVTSTPGDWQAFTAIWNSGAVTSAMLKLYDDNLADGGNDFALDDFSFQESAATPEPSSFTLFAGLAGCAWWNRRRRRGTVNPES